MFNCFRFLCFLSAIFLSLSLISAQTNYFVSHICGNTGNFTNNSTYGRNLNLLLSSLSSNVTRANGFKNITVGQIPNTIFGLFLCRGDVTPQFCQTCVELARKDVVQCCPNQIESIMYYEHCMLCYSYRSMFGIMQNNPIVSRYTSMSILDRDSFDRDLGKLLEGLKGQASGISSGPKFSTGSVNYTSFQTIYALLQCTPDLSQLDCNRCLEGARAYIPSCCDGRIEVRVILPSCNLRYEITPFYESRATPPSPSPLPSPLPNTTSTAPNSTNSTSGENGKKSSRVILAIVIPSAIALILLFTGAACLFVRKRKKEKAVDRYTI